MLDFDIIPKNIKMPSFSQTCALSLCFLVYLSRFLPRTIAHLTEFFLTSPENITYAVRSHNIFFNKNFSSVLKSGQLQGASNVSIDERRQWASVCFDKHFGSVDVDVLNQRGIEKVDQNFRDHFFKFLIKVCEELPKYPQPFSTPELPTHYAPSTPCFNEKSSAPESKGSSITIDIKYAIAILTATFIFSILLYRYLNNKMYPRNNNAQRDMAGAADDNPAHHLREIKRHVAALNRTALRSQPQLRGAMVASITEAEASLAQVSQQLISKEPPVESDASEKSGLRQRRA